MFFRILCWECYETKHEQVKTCCRPLPQQNFLIFSVNELTRHEAAWAAVCAVFSIYGSVIACVCSFACLCALQARSSTLLCRRAHDPELSSDSTRSTAEWPPGGRTHRRSISWSHVHTITADHTCCQPPAASQCVERNPHTHTHTHPACRSSYTSSCPLYRDAPAETPIVLNRATLTARQTKRLNIQEQVERGE